MPPSTQAHPSLPSHFLELTMLLDKRLVVNAAPSRSEAPFLTFQLGSACGRPWSPFAFHALCQPLGVGGASSPPPTAPGPSHEPPCLCGELTLSCRAEEAEAQRARGRVPRGSCPTCQGWGLGSRERTTRTREALRIREALSFTHYPR